jgi:hypothetical protein
MNMRSEGVNPKDLRNLEILKIYYYDGIGTKIPLRAYGS